MIFRDLIKTGTQFATTNAPVLLTAFGTVGVVTTAILTGKASYEAAKKISDAESIANMKREGGVERVHLDNVERFKLVWPLYISAVSSGVITCGAVVMAHRISSRRAVALAAAYAMSEGRLEEYQDKIKEKFGIKPEKEARDELSQEKVNRDYDPTEAVFSPVSGKVLIREDYTGRFFWSTIDAVNKAVNEINAHILTEGSARISDFYDLIGLSHVSTSDYFGWTKSDLLDIDWGTCTTPDGNTAVHTFEYNNHPVMDPEKEARNSFR